MTGVVVTLGKVGTPPDRPVISPAVVPTRVQQLRSEHVVRALQALGIAALSGKDAALTFPNPIQRDGPGWRAEVDLPYGVTATDVIEKRDRLASGLRRPLGCVWPEGVADEHSGRLVLWVGDDPLNKMRPQAWPLLTGGAFDLFDAVPFVIDQRGRPVAVPLVFANVLIGAVPRVGKTFSLRLLALAAALDPYARLRIFELKGTGDLGMCERVAHRYASGAGTDALDAAMQSLEELYNDLEKRAKTITRIAKTRPADCPENKVTRALCRESGLGLGLEVVIIDECQELFSHKDYRDDAERLCEGIIKRGPALGMIILLATQRPDAKSLPRSVSDNIVIRFALRMMTDVANDMILGTSSYKRGIRATLFTVKDNGVGYLVVVTDDALIGKTYYVDGPTADIVAERAYRLRQAAGTLSGDAVGESATRVDVVADVLRVAAGAERMWTSEILERLAGLRPEVYGGWTPEQLAAALRPAGALPQQVWGTDADGRGANRKGYALAEITRGT
jgi:S-DNA-T family DNA segregation ATPase FtsK/SpoIIIE